MYMCRFSISEMVPCHRCPFISLIRYCDVVNVNSFSAHPLGVELARIEGLYKKVGLLATEPQLQWNTDSRTTIFPLKSSKIRKKVGPGICWSETLLAGKSWSESYECRRFVGPRELIPEWWNSRNYRQIWVFLFVIYSWSQCPISMKLSESTYQTFLLVLQSQYRTKFA